MSESLQPLTAEQEESFLAERRAAKQRQAAAAESARLEREIVPSAPVPTFRRVPTVCVMCGKAFDGFEGEVTGLPTLKKLVCDPCVAIHDAEAARGTVKSPRLAPSGAWDGLCEPEFRSVAEGGRTDLARLARECPKLAEITGWTYGPKGFFIRGSTGKCKTRTVWRLLRVQFEAGRTISALTSGRFARECQDAAGKFTLSEWFDRLAKSDILFVDDLGKVKWTEFVWGQFFELIDDRAKNGRPWIITSNESRKTLEPKCPDPVTWGPLIRRLDENSTFLSL